MKIRILSILLLSCLLASPQEAYCQDTDNTEEESFLDWVWNYFFKPDQEEFHSDGWEVSPNQVSAYDNLRQVVDLQGYCKFNIGNNPDWKEADYNDKNWQVVKVPEDWERQGFNGYDGYAWYRIRFDGRLLEKNQNYFLMLGYIDDVDETYLNGQLIGQSGMMPPRFRSAYNAIRKYAIPSNRINYSGINVISVRVYDDYKNGGICGGDIGIYTPVYLGNLQVKQDLAGIWRFNTYDKSVFSESDFDDSGWKSILVPSYWDNHGYRSFDGVAWYRKSFELDFEPRQNETYYLVLGKIDDFDRTYFNGEKIGETNDNRSLGQSESFRRIRLYKIPHHLLKQSGMNHIAVRVVDIGIEGGIYSGLIGIVEASQLTKVVQSFNN